MASYYSTLESRMSADPWNGSQDLWGPYVFFFPQVPLHHVSKIYKMRARKGHWIIVMICRDKCMSMTIKNHKKK